MKQFFRILLLLFLSINILNGGIIWDTTKTVGKSATVYGAKKAWGYYKKQKSKKALTQNQKKKIFKKKEILNKHAPNGERTVYQRNIDPNLKVKRTVKGKELEETNLERMNQGLAPHIKKTNGKTEQVELHHSRQNNNGSVFELGKKVHQSRTNKGAEALHPYKTKRGRAINNANKKISGNKHPVNPVNRDLFKAEKKEHWKIRSKEIKKLLGKRIGQ